MYLIAAGGALVGLVVVTIVVAVLCARASSSFFSSFSSFFFFFFFGGGGGGGAFNHAFVSQGDEATVLDRRKGSPPPSPHTKNPRGTRKQSARLARYDTIPHNAKPDRQLEPIKPRLHKRLPPSFTGLVLLNLHKTCSFLLCPVFYLYSWKLFLAVSSLVVTKIFNLTLL